MIGSQPLLVDARVHREELRRFESRVVRGPRPHDCAIWTGAVGGDGYGRVRIRRAGKTRVVRAHRYALAAALGRPLPGAVNALHECDNPLCVRVSEPIAADAVAGPRIRHVVAGTQRDNMERMGRARRGGGRVAIRRGDSGRLRRRERSVALRDAVRLGWDGDAVASALLGSREPTLW